MSQWFELVVFTASMEIYGTAVADKLDGNQGMLNRRYVLPIFVPLPVFYTYQCVPVTWSMHVTHNNCTKVPLCRTLTLPKIYLLTTFTVPITNLYYPVQVLPPALHTGLWVLHQGLVCNLRRSLLRIYSRQLTGRIQGVPRLDQILDHLC